jgi:hypothetical protein
MISFFTIIYIICLVVIDIFVVIYTVKNNKHIRFKYYYEDIIINLICAFVVFTGFVIGIAYFAMQIYIVFINK